MWAEEKAFFWSTGHLNSDAELLPGMTVDWCLNAAQAAEKAVYLLVWLNVPAAAWLLWRERGRRKAAGLFCMVSLCGFFCVFLLIEVQARYRYVVMPLLFLLLGVTLDAVCREKRFLKQSSKNQVQRRLRIGNDLLRAGNHGDGLT